MYERDRMTHVLTHDERRIVRRFMMGKRTPGRGYLSVDNDHLLFAMLPAMQITSTFDVWFYFYPDCAVVQWFVAMTMGDTGFALMWEADRQYARVNDQRIHRHGRHHFCGPLSLLAWRATYQPQP